MRGDRRGSRPSRKRLEHGPPFSIVITDLGMTYVGWPQSRQPDTRRPRPDTPVHHDTGLRARGLLAENEIPAHVTGLQTGVLSKPPRSGNGELRAAPSPSE